MPTIELYQKLTKKKSKKGIDKTSNTGYNKSVKRKEEKKMKKIYEVKYVNGLDYNRGIELYAEKYFSTKEKAEKYIEEYKKENPERYMKAYINREIEVE